MTETASPAPVQARLDRMLRLEPFGGDMLVARDINGDGRLELLTLQSPAQFATSLCSHRSDVDEVDQALFCLTAVDLQGNVLWQIGEPYGRDFPYTSHGVQGGHQVAVADVDSDGAIEIVVIRRDELLVIDGRSGDIKRSVRLPADNFLVVDTAQMGDPAEGRQILCKVNDLAHKPWDYANPVVIYNADLSVRHEPFAVTGAGHNFVVRDVDGDGRDEIFVGYSLLDHDGRVVWTLDLGEGFDYVGDHADHIVVEDIDGDGALEVRYAGSEDFYVCDVQGRIRWSLAAGHSQQSMAGPWAADGSTRIIMAEKNAGLTGVTPRGKKLWFRGDINGYVTGRVSWVDSGGRRRSWGLFRPQLAPITPTPYQSDPGQSRELWPKLIDGDGQLHEVFPWQSDYAQPAQLIRAARSYDCGVKYYVFAVADADGGTDRLVVHDRRRVWLFCEDGRGWGE